MTDQKRSSNPFGCLPLALFVALIVGLASYGMGHTAQEAAWYAAVGGGSVIAVPLAVALGLLVVSVLVFLGSILGSILDGD